MEFTRKETNVAKGAAICLMFSNHLYEFPERLMHGNSYIPFIPWMDTELYLGRFGHICVAMFLFLSGYGLFLGYARSQGSSIRYCLKKLQDFYATYWLYLLIFVPIGMLFFKEVRVFNSSEARYSLDIVNFIGNFSGWSSSYNSEWWFVRMFVILLAFLCPIYLKLINQHLYAFCFLSLGLFATALFFKVDHTGSLGFLFWQMSFSVGLIFARLKLFSHPVIQYLDRVNVLWLFAGIFICVALELRIGARIDFLLAPLFIFLVVRLVEVCNLSPLFINLGINSFPLWLIHSFFCYYYFQDIIFFPKYSPLVFVNLMVFSLLTIKAVEYASSRLNSRIGTQA